MLYTRLSFILGVALLISSFYVFTNRLLLTHINQLGIEVERRVQHWDWIDTQEEQSCRSAHDLSPGQDPVPNVVHFIQLAEPGLEVELTYAKLLALKAAVLRMNATEIKFYTNRLNTANRWWNEISNHVTLITIEESEFDSLLPNGIPLRTLDLPHQSDVLRLSIISREGGIYLDTDVYPLKPFTDLLTNSRDVLLGHEGGNRYGLCNAVIIARPRSEFISVWQQTYSTFNPRVWNEHSVRMPKRLQVQYPELICPLSPTVFFWPTWATKHVSYMHQEILLAGEKAQFRADLEAFGGAMYENQLAFHATGAHEYLPGLTEDDVRERDSRFNVLVREIADARL